MLCKDHHLHLSFYCFDSFRTEVDDWTVDEHWKQMAAEGDVKRRSLVSVDSGVSVVSLEGGSRDSLAVADDASSLTSASSGSLLSLPVSHCNL